MKMTPIMKRLVKAVYASRYADGVDNFLLGDIVRYYENIFEEENKENGRDAYDGARVITEGNLRGSWNKLIKIGILKEAGTKVRARWSYRKDRRSKSVRAADPVELVRIKIAMKTAPQQKREKKKTYEIEVRFPKKWYESVNWDPTGYYHWELLSRNYRKCELWVNGTDIANVEWNGYRRGRPYLVSGLNGKPKRYKSWDRLMADARNGKFFNATTNAE